MTINFLADASGNVGYPKKRRRTACTFAAGVSSPQIHELNEGTSNGETERMAKIDLVHFVREVQELLGEEFDDYLQVMKDIKAMRIDTSEALARLEELFEGHPNLIKGINIILSAGYKITHPLEDDELPVNQCSFQNTCVFVKRIKMRFKGDQKHVYKSFLNILKAWHKGKKSYTNVFSEVKVLFTDHPDLLDGVASFFPNSSMATTPARRPITTPQTQIEVDKNFICHGDQELTAHGNLDCKETRYLANQNKHDVKGVSEFNLSECAQCTPSYYLLPKDCPRHLASQRTELDAQVLNDDWVCKAPRHIHQSFKNRSKNQYEETLFNCEDDRTIADLTVHWFDAAITSVKSVIEKFDKGVIKPDAVIRLEDYFTALNLRCIKMLYGDYSDEIIDKIRKNPTTALPVILKRLKSKKDEANQVRAQGKEVWAAAEGKCHQFLTQT